MIRTILVEDERLARQELSGLLKSHTDIEIIGEAGNADEAIELIEQLKPDLLFLDIQMPEKTGFELLEELISTPLVIFCTAYDEYALKAFESNALDYLVKPVQAERLKDALNKVRKQIQDRPVQETSERLNEQQQVFIKDGDKCWFVKVADIRRIESIGNYARIFFEDQKPMIHRTLNDLESRLPQDAFFRANRKEIINLRKVEKIEPYFSGGLLIFLNSGERVEISRRQAIRFREIMAL
jgi:two-component system LytT family response regulator